MPTTPIPPGSSAIEDAGTIVRGKECLVLGAGGAGSAAAHALQQAGGHVTIANRTIETVRRVAERVGCAHAGLDGELPARVASAEIVVNTLLPGVEVIEARWLSPRHVVLDAIYRDSYLRERVAASGAAYIPGTSWLLHQGAPAYHLFTSAPPDVKGMAAALASLPALPRHVSFIGFMGAGKSTTARIVGKMLGMPVADTDREIERRSGKSIPRLIRQEGEAAFREREFDVLQELLFRDMPTVISCGGGATLHPGAGRLLRERSIVTWLHASPGQCVKRINIASRPLLACHERPDEAAATIFEERKASYARAAWMLVATGERDPRQVSNIVYEEICKCIRG